MDEDKRINAEEAEEKNNAAMESKLKDARDIMSSAQAKFREYKEQIEHLEEKLEEAKTAKHKAAIRKAIAAVVDKQKELQAKLKSAQKDFNAVAKQKLVVANAAKAK